MKGLNHLEDKILQVDEQLYRKVKSVLDPTGDKEDDCVSFATADNDDSYHSADSNSQENEKVPLPLIITHGTTVLAIRLPGFLIFVGDGKMVTTRKGIIIDQSFNHVKVSLHGGSILLGQAGGADHNIRCKKAIEAMFREEDWKYSTAEVERVAKQVWNVARAKTSELAELAAYGSLVGGASIDDDADLGIQYRPQLYHVGLGQVENKNDSLFFSIGSGSQWANEECAVLNDDTSVEDAVEIAFRAIFNAWRKDVCTGGLVTVLTLDAKTLETKHYRTTIDDLQSYFGGPVHGDAGRKKFAFRKWKKVGLSGGSYLPKKDPLERIGYVKSCLVQDWVIR